MSSREEPQRSSPQDGYRTATGQRRPPPSGVCELRPRGGWGTAQAAQMRDRASPAQDVHRQQQLQPGRRGPDRGVGTPGGPGGGLRAPRGAAPPAHPPAPSCGCCDMLIAMPQLRILIGCAFPSRLDSGSATLKPTSSDVCVQQLPEGRPACAMLLPPACSGRERLSVPLMLLCCRHRWATAGEGEGEGEGVGVGEGCGCACGRAGGHDVARPPPQLPAHLPRGRREMPGFPQQRRSQGAQFPPCPRPHSRKSARPGLMCMCVRPLRRSQAHAFAESMR